MVNWSRVEGRCLWPGGREAIQIDEGKEKGSTKLIKVYKNKKKKSAGEKYQLLQVTGKGKGSSVKTLYWHGIKIG